MITEFLLLAMPKRAKWAKMGQILGQNIDSFLHNRHFWAFAVLAEPGGPLASPYTNHWKATSYGGLWRWKME